MEPAETTVSELPALPREGAPDWWPLRARRAELAMADLARQRDAERTTRTENAAVHSRCAEWARRTRLEQEAFSAGVSP